MSEFRAHDGASTPNQSPDAGEQSRLRVLCVDDYPRLLEALCKLINAEPDLTCCGTALSSEAFLASLPVLKPNVAVVDLTMPGEPDALEAISRAAGLFPELRIIAYSGYDDQETRTRAMDAGAWGLISKSCLPQDLLNGIRKVAKGELV